MYLVVIAIRPDMLLLAYAAGVFPMAHSRDDLEFGFVDPETRGIIPLDGFHVPRSLRKLVRKRPYRVRCDTAFEAVIDGCSEETWDRPDTWINAEIRELYLHLAEQGACHSVEIWDDTELVGGLYGVVLGSAFFGESMFSRVSNASKIALVHLVMILRRGGFTLLDCQFITDHLRQFGAIEIERAAYHALLNDALDRSAQFYCAEDDSLVDEFLQSMIQTS